MIGVPVKIQRRLRAARHFSSWSSKYTKDGEDSLGFEVRARDRHLGLLKRVLFRLLDFDEVLQCERLAVVEWPGELGPSVESEEGRRTD